MTQQFIINVKWGYLWARSSAECVVSWVLSFIRDILAKRWKAATFHWAPSCMMVASAICIVYKHPLLFIQLVPSGFWAAKWTGGGVIFSSTMAFSKGLMTADTTSFCRWNTPESSGLTPWSMRLYEALLRGLSSYAMFLVYYFHDQFSNKQLVWKITGSELLFSRELSMYFICCFSKEA